MTHDTTGTSAGAGDWILGALRRHPEGLLLLAAGAALLMRNGSRPSRRPMSGAATQWEPAGYAGERRSSIGETVAKAGRDAGDYLSDVAEKVSETAGSYTSAVSDYADDAMRAVSEQSRHLARQAQSGFERTTDYVLERQPLAIAMLGLAAGAAAAAAFPPTDVERRALGPTGERLRDAAGEVAERVKEAGAKAGERLMSAAEERGLSAEGLKEVARDVGQTLGEAMSGAESSGEGQAPRGGQTQATAPSRQSAGGTKRGA